MARPRAGDLDTRITIEQGTTVADAHGQKISTWATLVQLWAKVETLATSEQFGADRNLMQKRKMFTVRWYESVTTRCRLLVNSETYDILQVFDLEQFGRKRWMTILGELKS